MIPDEKSRQYIETNCDTITKMLTAKCIVKIRFVYDGFEEKETSDGDKMLLVAPKDGALAVTLKK